MKHIVFLAILVLCCSCGQAVLEKKYNSKTFSKDTIQLKKELDPYTFSIFKTFIKEKELKSFTNLKYKTLVIMSGSYINNQSIKELADTIAKQKKILCSKKWKFKKSKTFVPTKTKVSDYKKVKADNMVFEKENKSISFKEDNTFEQIGNDNAKVVKGKWSVSPYSFSFDDKSYKMVSMNEKKILLTKVVRGSNDGDETIITDTIELLAF